MESNSLCLEPGLDSDFLIVKGCGGMMLWRLLGWESNALPSSSRVTVSWNPAAVLWKAKPYRKVHVGALVASPSWAEPVSPACRAGVSEDASWWFWPQPFRYSQLWLQTTEKTSHPHWALPVQIPDLHHQWATNSYYFMPLTRGCLLWNSSNWSSSHSRKK